MCKKYIVLVLIPSLLLQFCGCYSMKEIPMHEMSGLKEGGDLIVHTKDSTIYFFEKSNYQILNDSINGKGYAKFSDANDFKIVKNGAVALTNIETIQQDDLNLVTTGLLVGSILLVVIVGIVIVFGNSQSSDVSVSPIY
jgi:hypothetical protein